MKIGVLGPINWDDYTTLAFALDGILAFRDPEGLTLCALELGSFPQLVEQMCRDRKYEFQLLPAGIDNMLAHVDKVLLLHGTNGKWHSMIDMILASGVPLSTYDLTPAPMVSRFGKRR